MKVQNIIIIALVISFAGCKKEVIDNTQPPTTIIVNDSSDLESGDCIEYTQYLGQNIIQNGSFEEGHNLGNNQWNVFDHVGAWYADTTYNDAGIEIQKGQNIGDLAPSDGDSKLEFDAHNKNGYSASDVEVYQVVDTDDAEDYILTFDYSPRIAGNEKTNAAEVYFDGNLVASLNSEVKGWQKYTLIVKGAGNATRLSFKGYIDNDTVGGYLDNIKLKKLMDNAEGATESIVAKSCVLE